MSASPDTTCLNCGTEGAQPTACDGCGMSEEAATSFLGISAQADPVASALTEISNGLARRGLARLNRLLREDPASTKAWRTKADVYQRLGFHDSAVRTLCHAANVTNTPSLLISAGFSLQQLQRHEDAVAVYREFVDQAATSGDAGIAFCNLANSLSNLGRDAEAEEAFGRAIELEPERPTHFFNLYVHLRKGKQWPKAIAVLKRGLPHAADKELRVSFLLALSYAHAERDQGPEALAAADEAVALDGGSTGAHYLRGRGLALVGRLEEAMTEMQSVLLADPEHRDAKNAVAMLERAGVGDSKRPWWRFWN